MPITNSIYSFTTYNIEHASPDRRGVYALYDGQQLIYYGRASNSIRDRLRSHKNGHEGHCTQVATHFNWEETNRPIERERDLLEEYRQVYGHLPRCNERVG
jgi:excinuclease UvrABC nuclease subunit